MSNSVGVITGRGQRTMPATTNGYTASGSGTSDTNLATIAKLVFSTEATSTLANSLPNYKMQIGCRGAQSATKMYGAGGSNNVNTFNVQSSIYQLTFSGETTGTVGVSLSVARKPTHGQSSVAAYFTGGITAGLGMSLATDKLLFSGETISTVGNNTNVGARGSMFCSTYIAINAGGLNIGTCVNTMSKLTFSADTFSSLSATLDIASYEGGVVTYLLDIGYLLGSDTDSGPVNTNRKILLGNQTVSVLSSTLANINASGGSCNSATKGYVMGGHTTNTVVATVFSFTYSNETAGLGANNLPQARHTGWGGEN